MMLAQPGIGDQHLIDSRDRWLSIPPPSAEFSLSSRAG
jgi:hypothetical protein